MGCVCCVPESMDLPGSAFLPNPPSNILQLTTKPEHAARRAEAEEVLARSFCGTQEKSPEATLSWILDPNASAGGNPAAPLSEAPSEARLNFFRCMIKFCMEGALRHGGCFALTDGNDKVVAATITVPPNNKHLYKQGICELIYITQQIGGAGALDPAMKSGPSAKRMEVMGKVMEKMHKECASGRHLYIFCFGTAVDSQGQGHGKELFTFLNNACDHMGCGCYLEASGASNERFYTNNGLHVVKRYKMEHNGLEFQPDGLNGMSAMVRGNTMAGSGRISPEP